MPELYSKDGRRSVDTDAPMLTPTEWRCLRGEDLNVYADRDMQAPMLTPTYLLIVQLPKMTVLRTFTLSYTQTRELQNRLCIKFPPKSDFSFPLMDVDFVFRHTSFNVFG